jgi:SAM-dependent methyltransferase
MSKPAPQYDRDGLNVLDPHDSLGLKSAYITLLHTKALMRYLPSGDGTGLAVDVGCGYGRLTPVMAGKGWRVTGIDPDDALLDHARLNYPGAEYRQGALPDLPLEEGSVDLMLLQNVLRPLLMKDRLNCLYGVGRFLSPGGVLIVVENVRPNHSDYVPEPMMIEIFESEGLRLRERIPIRAGRWWLTYLIRYGMIPETWFGRIAEYELQRCRSYKGKPTWQYMNVMFIFERGEPTRTR